MSSGLVSASAPLALAAEKLSCLPVQHMTETSAVAPANKKIGVSVAYLKVPFYANFKTGLEDGAKQFGFTYDLVDGNSGDVATELANLQNFIAQKKDLILLTPSGRGDHSRHQAGQRCEHSDYRSEQQGRLRKRRRERADLCRAPTMSSSAAFRASLLDQAFGGKKAKVAYVMGFAGTSPQILRAKGWDEFRAKNPQYEEVARVDRRLRRGQGARRRAGSSQPVPEGPTRRHRHAGA